MFQQITNTLLMIRPSAFQANELTKEDNFYQKEIDLNPKAIQEKALKEFDDFVEKLRQNEIQVLVIPQEKNNSPDAVFPNNWVSFHQDKKAVLYPMKHANRRLEKNLEVFQIVKKEWGREYSKIIDYSHFEQENTFLEGTGSLVLDRKNRLAFASLSERTNLKVLEKFCTDLDFKAIIFHSFQDPKNQSFPIYHTNVMMSIGEEFVLIALETIPNSKEKKQVIESIENTQKTIVEISAKQVQDFAGNILQVKNKAGKKFIILSEQAFKSLNSKQKKILEKENQFIQSSLKTIETCGGGSARCMLAEVF